MGGTFIDETAAWNDRIRRTAAANGISEAEFRAAMERAAEDNLPEYAAAMQSFGIAFREPWEHSLERLCDGAEEALKSLYGKYRLGIIANQSLGARERLEKLGVLKYFDLPIISAEVGFSKPSPILFREALYKAQTTADRCFMVGDKLTNDIAPAKALGFGTVWVKREWGGMNRIESEAMRPDFTVDSILTAAEIFNAPAVR